MLIDSENQTLAEAANSSPLFSSKKSPTISEIAPIVIFTINSSGYFTSFDGSVLSQYGITKESIFATSIFSENSIFLPAKRTLKRALNGESVTETIDIFGASFSLFASATYNNEGLNGVTVTCIETTEHKETELALREIQRHYLLLAEHTTDLITKYAADGICTYASPAVAKVLGYRPDELLGKPVFHFFHTEDLKSKRRYFTKLLLSRAPKGRYVYLARNHKQGHLSP